MAVTEVYAVAVSDQSQTAEARRTASALAARLGFAGPDVGRVALVATEAATNIVKHTTGGEILLRAVAGDGTEAVDIVAIDRGPGIDNVRACLEDGYSTTGSPGTGLGAIARLASVFDIYSSPRGTAVLARVVRDPRAAVPARSALEIDGLSVSKPGEEVCGDAWAVEPRPTGAVVLVADGLGHGPLAADAAREAVRAFRQYGGMSPAAIVDRVHLALRPTRGAAVAVTQVDVAAAAVTFAGVGNIAAVVLGDGAPRRLVSHYGTAGHEVSRVQEFTGRWAAGSTLVVHSDGLATHWALDGYPGLLTHHPRLVAAVLYRDFSRRRDDVTVVIGKDIRS